MLGILVVIHELGHFVTARLARRPGPRVRDRLPAAGEGPPLGRRDALHAELAADRRVRPARGRGRRLGRPALVRPSAAADQAGHPRRRRGDEPGPGVRDLLRDLRPGLPDLDADDRQRPARQPGGGRGTGQPATTSSTLDGQRFDGFGNPGLRPARPGRPDGRARRSIRADGTSETLHATLRKPEDITVTSGALGISFARPGRHTSRTRRSRRPRWPSPRPARP